MGIAAVICRFRNIGIIEQAAAEFHRENTLYSFIDSFFLYQTPSYRFLQLLEARIPQPHIHARIQRQCAGGSAVTSDRIQLIDGHTVGHNKAPEAIFPPEKFRQQPVVGMAVNTVDFIVGCHKGRCPRIHAGLHRGQVDLPKLPFTNSGRTGVDTAGGFPLGAHMLGNHIHALTLDAPNCSRCHPGGKVGIFAEALLTSAPAGIPEYIQRRNQRQIDAHGLQLLSADL